MGAGNAMNHTGPLCWWNWLVGLQLRPSGHSYVNVSRLDYETWVWRTLLLRRKLFWEVMYLCFCTDKHALLACVQAIFLVVEQHSTHVFLSCGENMAFPSLFHIANAESDTEAHARPQGQFTVAVVIDRSVNSEVINISRLFSVCPYNVKQSKRAKATSLALSESPWPRHTVEMLPAFTLHAFSREGMADGWVTEWSHRRMAVTTKRPSTGSVGKTGQPGKSWSLWKLTLKTFTAPDIAVTHCSVNILSTFKQAVECSKLAMMAHLVMKCYTVKSNLMSLYI